MKDIVTKQGKDRKKTFVNHVSDRQLTSNEKDQNMPSLNLPHWPSDYFELKATKKE